MNLVAKGYSSLDGVTPMYLWNSGNYKYEIEVVKNNYTKNVKYLILLMMRLLISSKSWLVTLLNMCHSVK